MTARLRPHVPAALAALAGMAVMAWLGLIGFAWTDYDIEASGAFKSGGGRPAEARPILQTSSSTRALSASLAGVAAAGSIRAASFFKRSK